jgi:hypothetical protein
MGKLEELQAEIERLKTALNDSDRKKTQAEEMAQVMASMNPLVGSTSEEQATGRTVKVEVCTNPWERNEKKQKFHTVEFPTYYYNIQLPAGAGLCLITNGQEYYHGQTYEFTSQELPEIKDRVAKCWWHEKAIHGENENAYKKPTSTHLMTPAAAMNRRS